MRERIQLRTVLLSRDHGETTIMKKILLSAVAGAALIAGCGVDREGTRDNIVKELEALGTVDADCVDAVLDKYSDDELKAMDKEAADLGTGTPSEELLQYTSEMFECLSTS